MGLQVQLGCLRVVTLPMVLGCPSPSPALPCTWGTCRGGGPAVHSRTSSVIQDLSGIMEKVMFLWLPLPNPGQTSTEGAFPGVNWVILHCCLERSHQEPRLGQVGFELLLHLESLWGVEIDLLHRLLTPGTPPASLVPHQQGTVRAQDVLARGQAAVNPDGKSTVLAKMNWESLSLP